MKAVTETTIEPITQWTCASTDGASGTLFASTAKSTSLEKQQRIPLGGIALAASLVVTSIALPNSTDRFDQTATSDETSVPNFRCEENCTSLPLDDAVNARTKFMLAQELDALFRNAKSEIFESARESNFAHQLHELLLQYGRPVIAVLSESSFDSRVDAETMSETLRVIGRAHDVGNLVSRFRLLIQGLNSPSPIIRDSAALALSDLGEPGAIPYLKEAAEREEYVSLHKDYLQIAEDLEEA
jgi:hypothetical protein